MAPEQQLQPQQPLQPPQEQCDGQLKGEPKDGDGADADADSNLKNMYNMCVGTTSVPTTGPSDAATSIIQGNKRLLCSQTHASIAAARSISVGNYITRMVLRLDSSRRKAHRRGVQLGISESKLGALNDKLRSYARECRALEAENQELRTDLSYLRGQASRAAYLEDRLRDLRSAEVIICIFCIFCIFYMFVLQFSVFVVTLLEWLEMTVRIVPCKCISIFLSMTTWAYISSMKITRVS